VMLGYLDSTAAVGQFAVAQKLPLALYGVVDLWSATLYPQVARLIISDRERLRGQIEVFMTLSLAVALPLCVGGALTGHDLIPRLFGSAYTSADTAFALLLAALSIALLTVNLGSVLAAGGQERRYALAVSAGAVANVLVNFISIPLLGIDGAAAATIAAEVAILVFVARRYRIVVGPLRLDLPRLARIALAVVIMAGVLAALGSSVNVFPRIVIGAFAYVGAALALGVITRSELRMLRAGGTA
jgi:O-antigen/teichoic acid export membrane protein